MHFNWHSLRSFGFVCLASGLCLSLAGEPSTAAASGLVRSERFCNPWGQRDPCSAEEAAAQGCGPPLFVRHVERLLGHLPWIGRGGVQGEPLPIQPPLSRFHPVPTRPVFEPRATYAPPYPVPVRNPHPRLHPGHRRALPYAGWERFSTDTEEAVRPPAPVLIVPEVNRPEPATPYELVPLPRPAE